MVNWKKVGKIGKFALKIGALLAKLGIVKGKAGKVLVGGQDAGLYKRGGGPDRSNIY